MTDDLTTPIAHLDLHGGRPRILGRAHCDVLEKLIEHGQWYSGCGWDLNGPRRTRTSLESLRQYALVEVGSEMSARQTRVYLPTADGVALVTSWREKKQAPIGVRTWKVWRVPEGGLVLTINGTSYLLGDSAASIEFELQQRLKVGGYEPAHAG